MILLLFLSRNAKYSLSLVYIATLLTGQLPVRYLENFVFRALSIYSACKWQGNELNSNRHEHSCGLKLLLTVHHI
jgi:hypothetical protein